MTSYRRSQHTRSSSASAGAGELTCFCNFKKIEPPRTNYKKRRPATTATKSAAEIKKPNETAAKDSILRIGSPVKEKNDDDKGVDESYGGFLKGCSFCKKPITKDVFMYGYLRAYCSHGCRDAQIALDEKFRPPSPIPMMVLKLARYMDEHSET